MEEKLRKNPCNNSAIMYLSTSFIISQLNSNIHHTKIKCFVSSFIEYCTHTKPVIL